MAKQTEQFERKAVKSKRLLFVFFKIPQKDCHYWHTFSHGAYELGIFNSENGTTGLKGFYAINLL